MNGIVHRIQWVYNFTDLCYFPTNVSYFIFNHLRLCLATVTRNLTLSGHYSHLINLKPNISKTWCLNTHFIPNNSDLICWYNELKTSKVMLRGFVKLKKIPKIREKLGTGWVGQDPTRISFLFGNIVFFCVFFSLFMFPEKLKKLDRQVGWWGLDNPSLSRIFGFFLT